MASDTLLIYILKSVCEGGGGDDTFKIKPSSTLQKHQVLSFVPLPQSGVVGMMDYRGLATMAWETGKKDRVFCPFLTNNREGCTSSSWPPSVMAQMQKQSPIMQSRFGERLEERKGEGDNSCEVFFLSIFLFFF